MDSDMQLNISVPKKVSKTKPQSTANKPGEYSFVSKPVLVGKTIARKRTNKTKPGKILDDASDEVEPKNFKSKRRKDQIESTQKPQTEVLSERLRELSENKGKYKNQNYQELSDEIQLKAKSRPGGWVSSLFKNNPTVPKIGQRLVKPIFEKVFSGKHFTDLNIHPHTVSNLQQNLGLKELTTVQQKASPIMLEGRDVLVRSQTGSGKTLAYALPLIEGLQAIRPKINRHDGIRVLVIVPTRELAVQTYELFVKLVKPFTWIVPGLLSGGQKRKAEKARLRKGLSILVGTPGRIYDHLRHTQSLNFSKTRCLILDEADRLLDMGYEKDVAAIVAAIESHKQAATYDPLSMIKKSVKNFDNTEQDVTEESKIDDPETKHNITQVLMSDQRQTVLLSATLTKAVENLAGLTLVDPVFVDTSEGRAVVADSLKINTTNPTKSHEMPKLDISKKEIDQNVSEELQVKPKKLKLIKVSKENETISEDENELTNDEIRLGMRHFNGSKFSDLFEKSSNIDSHRSNSEVPAQMIQKMEESDSDSDYEYFKVNKQNAQKNEEKSEVSEEENVVVNTNTFQEALQNAVEDDELVIPASVVQKFLITPMKLRLVTLCAMIIKHCVLNKKGGKMIVFMATTEMVDFHAELLETVLTGKKVKKNKSESHKDKAKSDKSDDESSLSEVDSDYEVPLPGQVGTDGLVPVELQMFALHGSMPHPVRIDVFNKFRAARSSVLLCTDVAARGLDLPRVDLVLQYCAPASATDYVHRVGRTGRATHVGSAMLLLLPSEAEFVRYLEEKRIRLSQEDERLVLESLRPLAPGAASSQRAAVATQASLEHLVHRDKEWLAKASRAYTSWVRFYAGYPRPVRPYLDSRSLHLGHAAKSFALRDAPGAAARRARADPRSDRQRPANRLTVDKEKEKRRPGFSKAPASFKRSLSGKQSSMHSASEFDSGLEPVEKKKKFK